MRHMAYRLAVFAMAGGLASAMSTPAVTAAPLTVESGCTVQHVDERGRVVQTESAREGAVYGQFRCVHGQWQLPQSPFDRGDAVTAEAVQVDRAGAVAPSRLVGPALGNDLTLAQTARLAQAVSGGGEAVANRVVVIADDGVQRTPDQVRAAAEGHDNTTGARILGVVDRPDQARSIGDIIGDVGGTPEGTVVYILGDIWDWIVDTVSDAAGWIWEHCDITETDDGIIIVSCRF